MDDMVNKFVIIAAIGRRVNCRKEDTADLTGQPSWADVAPNNFKVVSDWSRGGGGSLADKCATHPRSNTSEMDPKWRITYYIKFAPLNGVTPVKHNLNGVIRGVTYPKWRILLWYTVQYLRGFHTEIT